MRSPSSPCFPSDSWEESSCSRQAVVAADHQDSFRSAPYSPVRFRDQATILRQDVTPAKLRRRASQSCLLTKPSTVSRFLSKSNSPLRFQSENLGRVGGSATKIESRTHSADSRLHLSATSSSLSGRASSSTVWDSASKGNSPGDYPSALPPTPPDDDEHVAWNPSSGMLLFESQVKPDHGSMPMDEGPNIDNRSRSSAQDSLGSPSDQSSNGASSAGGSPRSPSGDMDCDPSSWLENGIDSAVSSLPYSNARGEAVKIVSQMLPYPRAADKSSAPPTDDSVFCSLVQTVQNRLQQGQSPYINVTHAVPEQFSLSNLPSSPPNTPRLLFPGDDYFNSTIFSSAAVVSAYHDFRGPIQMHPAHFPMPVVPPHSVHISVLERYLPPSSAQEYKDFFSPNRPSFLADRMSELSPEGGSLLLIYPTRRGAQTFKSQYLGPILDPLLRQLVVVNELSADMGRYLGKMSSVSQMEDFDTMKSNIDQLCRSLSSASSQFSVVDARKGSAGLDRKLWTEWFIHQDKARMKEVLTMYWQNGRRLPANKAVSTPQNHMLADKEVTSAMLLGEILDGIRRRPYGEENEPRDGVELGVFVIRRSH
ncbi:hypothetical protein MW887_005369 [Aspergillus wentii]|nr:hypothetical protein MW887_005369 [Aspergillus wentii]